VSVFPVSLDHLNRPEVIDVKVEVLQDYRMSKRAEETEEMERERKRRFEAETRGRLPEALHAVEEFGEACFGRKSPDDPNYRIQTGGHLILLTGKLDGDIDSHAVELYLGAATDDFFAWYLTLRETSNPVELLHFSTTDLSEAGLRDGLRQAAAIIAGPMAEERPYLRE
jgi:hypothetical protein